MQQANQPNQSANQPHHTTQSLRLKLRRQSHQRHQKTKQESSTLSNQTNTHSQHHNRQLHHNTQQQAPFRPTHLSTTKQRPYTLQRRTPIPMHQQTSPLCTKQHAHHTQNPQLTHTTTSLLQPTFPNFHPWPLQYKNQFQLQPHTLHHRLTVTTTLHLTSTTTHTDSQRPNIQSQHRPYQRQQRQTRLPQQRHNTQSTQHTTNQTQRRTQNHHSSPTHNQTHHTSQTLPIPPQHQHLQSTLEIQ